MNKAISPDWRSKTMSRIRALIKQADPEVVEEVKYKKPSNPAGIPVWYHDGMICTGETYKNHLRLTFAKELLSRIRRACSTDTAPLLSKKVIRLMTQLLRTSSALR